MGGKIYGLLEYEDCHSLRFALDILRNLPCYEWIPYEDLASSTVGPLKDADIPQIILDSGCFDLIGYKAGILEKAGYRLTGNGRAYVARNGQEFVREFTGGQASPEEHGEEPVPQEQGGMTMQ